MGVLHLSQPGGVTAAVHFHVHDVVGIIIGRADQTAVNVSGVCYFQRRRVFDQSALKDLAFIVGSVIRMNLAADDHRGVESGPAVVVAASGLLDPEVGIDADDAIDVIQAVIIDIGAVGGRLDASEQLRHLHLLRIVRMLESGLRVLGIGQQQIDGLQLAVPPFRDGTALKSAPGVEVGVVRRGLPGHAAIHGPGQQPVRAAGVGDDDLSLGVIQSGPGEAVRGLGNVYRGPDAAAVGAGFIHDPASSGGISAGVGEIGQGQQSWLGIHSGLAGKVTLPHHLQGTQLRRQGSDPQGQYQQEHRFTHSFSLCCLQEFLLMCKKCIKRSNLQAKAGAAAGAEAVDLMISALWGMNSAACLFPALPPARRLPPDGRTKCGDQAGGTGELKDWGISGGQISP